ncbi:MAG: glycerol-3-phosphate 1-O-acyltransferase PlsY [Candidatus Hydrogenedentes bacterium]|nr:glycerol-3-phosphate 1-O-acyltransferase PlsY [Candidatus Hydrogenedentota bacterium]
MMYSLLAVLLSYLLGSIPTGLWLGQWLRGVDIREHGSKNIGATNTLRVLGKGLGAAALLGDALKGLIPVLLFSHLSDWPYAPLACGVAAIVGHLAPLYLKFKGGKGVATSAGVFLALCPIPTLAAVAVFAITVLTTRLVSAASMLSAVAMTLIVYFVSHDVVTAPAHLLPNDYTLRIVVTVIAVLIIYRHRGNIQRILKGTENKI